MQGYFARRTSWNLTANRYSQAVEFHRKSGREVLDLTASNPTTVGLAYEEDKLLRALAQRQALQYDPQPKGLEVARAAVAAYYAERGSDVSPDDILLTTSTSEAYGFVFRLLGDPGDTVLVPTPSYPLFDFLADLQDIHLVAYELVYDHGWQIDFPALESAIAATQATGSRCRAVLLVHPNNPTGSYIAEDEGLQLQRLCAANDISLIVDEVFLDYSMGDHPPLTFAGGQSRQAATVIDPELPSTLTFTLSGLSKISALPQMKVAWIAVNGPEALKTEALARLEVIADTYLSMNAPIQWAIPTFLEERHSIQAQLRIRLRENLAELDRQLAGQLLCHRLVVEGGWSAVLRVPATQSDEQLAVGLLSQTGVLVQPGHFYDFAGDGHLVISLIVPQSQFSAGIQRLLRFVADTCE